MPKIIRKTKMALEAGLAYATYGLLRMMPLDMASGLGGWVACQLGPKTNVHRVAMRNLSNAMPELNEQQQHDVVMKMWNNLGRVFAEYPHLNSPQLHQRIRVVAGLEHVEAIRHIKAPVLFVSGHLGNWEVAPLAAALHGLPLHLLFRAANNTIIDRMIKNIRARYSLGLYAKGEKNTRNIVRAMQQNEPVGMLIDQKTNDGMAALFFGKEAMTSIAAAQFVTKFNTTILPSYCVRTKGANFEVTIEAPMTFELTGDHQRDIAYITQALNDRLESWIRQDPSQWFWVHKRWPHSKICKV